MGIKLDSILIENFKSYGDATRIHLSDLSVFMGANSSGKSTALQTLLAVKQTMECNSPDIDLLLWGKYVTLGDFEDAVNDASKGYFRLGISVIGMGERETYSAHDKLEVVWKFVQEKEIRLGEMDFQIENSVKNKFFTREICAYAQTRRLSKNGGLV